MNILYLTNHLNVGGITTYVLTLAGGLRKRGHKIYIASSGGELLPRFEDEGIVYIPIPIRTKQEFGLKVFISFLKLRSLIKQEKIDIIHSNTRATQVLGCLLSKKTKVIHISTCHGFFKKRLSRRIFPCWGGRVIAISDEVGEHLRKDFGVNEDKIRLVHNGIDVEKFTLRLDPKQAKRNLGLSSEAPVISIIARLSDVKGHIYLIEAMKEVLKEFPLAQLLIVGEGKMEILLRNKVTQLGIDRSVFFRPEVRSTQEVLSAIDIFVLPSLKEGLGLSLMEAMAASCAVIGSDIGGIKSLIRHNDNGLMVQPKDSQGLAAAILELLANPQKAEKLGKKASLFIRDKFSAGKMVLQTEEVYRLCLKPNA